MNIYDFKVENSDGTYLDLKKLKGKVILIVNTATGCGFTPQYKQLQELQDKYHDKGLEIIDIPCNQFKQQAPGTDQEITSFCQLNYGTAFPQRKKAEVNGDNELELYTFLKKQQPFKTLGKSAKALYLDAMFKKMNPDYKNNDDIKWNFTKFLIDREGNVVRRIEPTTAMWRVKKAVEELL